MIKYFKFVLLLSCLVFSVQANLLAGDPIIKSEPSSDKKDKKVKKRRSKKVKRSRANGFKGGLIKKRMDDFLKTVPIEHHEKAQKIITYLHTSHRVARSHMKNKNNSAALEVFSKRLRLKVPDFFDKAPPILKYFKLATKSAMGKIHLGEKNGEKALQVLEVSYEEALKYEDFPKPMMIRLRHQLMRAYRMVGMADKAEMMLESALREAEADLEFE